MGRKQESGRRWILFIPFLAALIFWMVIYSYTFLQGDDYRFSVNGGSFPRIWDSYLKYYTYGGARMGNLLAGVFLMMDMRVWKILTAVVVVLLSLLFFYYVRGSLHSDGMPDRHEILLACVCAVFPGLLPMSSQLFSDTFLWLDGSTNYIYPLLLMMVGFLPFYNKIRGRSLPKIFSWLSPICFLAAALLHEQVTMMLLLMCVVTLLYLRKNRAEKIPLSFKVLTFLNAVVLVFMLTAPGAYFRMKQENTVQESVLRKLTDNFMRYFSPLVNDYWPWLVAMGFVAIFLLERKGKGQRKYLYKFIQFYLCFGALLAPLSRSLHLPMLQFLPKIDRHSRLQMGAEAILTVFWLLYILLIFAALLICAHEKEPNRENPCRYLPVLYAGMWASQAIPAVATHCCGRARMLLYAFALLMIFCVLWDYGRSIRWADILQSALILIGVLSFACIARGAIINGTAASHIEQQITEVQKGQRNTVLIDYNQFDWTFCNVTFNFKPDRSALGYETAMRKYYHLPDTATFQYTRARTGRGIAAYIDSLS